jgi:tetratricopeptide (TPR) repeat protein
MQYQPLDYFRRAEEAGRMGNIDRKIDILRELVSLCQLNREPADYYGEALRWLGNAYQNKNDLARAHNYRIEALRVVEALGARCDNYLAMCVTGDLGRSFIALGEWAQAEEYTRRALELADRITDLGLRQEGRCIYGMNLSLVLSNIGKVDEAIRRGEQVLRDAGSMAKPYYIMALQNGNLASMQLHENRLNVSQRHARLAMVYADFCDEPAIKRNARRILGDCLFAAWTATGNKQYGNDAERMLKKVAVAAERDGDFTSVAETELRLVQIATAQQREEAATRHCERGIEALERERTILGFDEFSQSYFSRWEVTYQRVAKFQLRRQAPERAFLTSERSRNRLLLARLGAAAANVASWNQAQKTELIAILDSYGTEVIRACRADLTRGGGVVSTLGLRSGSDRSQESDPAPIRNARESYLRLQNRQRLLSTRWSTRLMSPVAEQSEIREGLAKDEAMIIFYLCDDGVIVFALTNESMHFQEVPYSRAKLDAKVQELCEAMASMEPECLAHLKDPILRREWWSRRPGEAHPPQIEGLFRRLLVVLQDLFTVLIVPLLSIVESKRNWVIVPHGPLHRVPWAALWTGSSYVVERHNVALLPSASFVRSMAARTIRPGGSDIFLAGAPDPPEDALRLPGAAAELAAARETLGAETNVNIGRSATKEVFRERAPGARLIHVAAHHFFDGSVPGLSFLKLAGDSGSHFLYASEVAEMQLDAQLAVLSACDTARSQVVTGDEQYGMVRSFLAAGVRSVISTLWAIEDQSAVPMFSQFYRASTKVPLSEALANSQRRMLDRSPYDLPYFWAPYVLSGESNRPLELNTTLPTEAKGVNNGVI